MRQQQTPEQYWASVEQEIGEAVKGYVLARLPAVTDPERLGLLTPGPKWGLAFLTESTLYIDRSSTPNWFQRMIQRDRSSDEQERTQIPVRAMTQIDIPESKRGFARILKSPEIQIDIHYIGSDTPLRMMLDWRGPTDKAFISLLSEIADCLNRRGED